MPGSGRDVREFDVHGKQVHDCNIVARMPEHGVRHLGTRSATGFKRYQSLISIESVGD